jgi:diketogulonate reductase-like aldo/keto reductase
MAYSTMVMFSSTWYAVTVAKAYQVPNSVEIAPGVTMPVVNLGGVSSKPSNYTAFLSIGGVGLDAAFQYGAATQEKLGKAVKTSSLPRSNIFITTKIPCCPMFPPWTSPLCNNTGPANASGWIKGDLGQLGVAYVDLILLHMPCDTMEHTMAAYGALEKMHKAGFARAIGVSNFNVSMMQKILARATTRPAVNQCGYSIAAHNGSAFPGGMMIGRDDATRYVYSSRSKTAAVSCVYLADEMFLRNRGFCTQNGVTYQAYSPLGGLSGVDVLGNPTVKSIAAAHNVSAAQVLCTMV